MVDQFVMKTENENFQKTLQSSSSAANLFSENNAKKQSQIITTIGRLPEKHITRWRTAIIECSVETAYQRHHIKAIYTHMHTSHSKIFLTPERDWTKSFLEKSFNRNQTLFQLNNISLIANEIIVCKNITMWSGKCRSADGNTIWRLPLTQFILCGRTERSWKGLAA